MAILDALAVLGAAAVLAGWRIRRRGRDRRTVDRYHRTLAQLERAEARVTPTGDRPRST